MELALSSVPTEELNNASFINYLFFNTTVNEINLDLEISDDKFQKFTTEFTKSKKLLFLSLLISINNSFLMQIFKLSTTDQIYKINDVNKQMNIFGKGFSTVKKKYAL